MLIHQRTRKETVNGNRKPRIGQPQRAQDAEKREEFCYTLNCPRVKLGYYCLLHKKEKIPFCHRVCSEGTT